LTANFVPGEPGLASFIEAKDDGSGGDSWIYKLRSNRRQHQETNTHRRILGTQKNTTMAHTKC